MIRYCCFILVLFGSFCFGETANAQDSLGKKRNFGSVSKAAGNLRKSLSANDNDLQTAINYEALAKELIEKNDYAKAEYYLKKAVDIYTRLKHENAATASRELAKVQEVQNKMETAISNYRSAGNLSLSKDLEQANYNDANRLLNIGDPHLQTNYAQSNIAIFEKGGKNAEVADAYKKLGNSLLLQNNKTDAIASYKKAIEKSDNTIDINALGKKISKVYVADNKIADAISINEAILAKARKEKNTELQINQALDLAQLFTRNQQFEKAGNLLEEAYTLACKSGSTSKARDCLLALTAHYRGQRNEAAAITRYNDFLLNLDSLIKRDSSLVDAGVFDITEGKIKDLEREKALQQALIKSKNHLNYILIASIFAMIVLLIFILQSLRAIKVKNKKIALQSLRREMNPHFIFNSLNSVNQYIAENNEVEANKYLTSYSGLMRNVMEHSYKDFVPLAAEAEQLRRYLDLEHLRFSDKFVYRLDIDDNLDPDMVMVPNMLIQPHLENAIWHGLRYKDSKGLLMVTFKHREQHILVEIEDNGIGLTESFKLKTLHQKEHQSRGITNTRERIGLLNDIYHLQINLEIHEITSINEKGTKVVMQLPLMYKHDLNRKNNFSNS